VVVDVRCRTALGAAEGHADRPLPTAQLDRISADAEEAYEDAITDHQDAAESDRDAVAARSVAHAASYASNPNFRFEDVIEVMETAADAAPSGCGLERVRQAALIGEIFGNPYRPIGLDPTWLSSTVVSLAEGIYADRAFDRLLILADALQDAGCENSDVLAHCCVSGPHVRGCWVVDLVLGKSKGGARLPRHTEATGDPPADPD
jgi:hypothetical protein